MWHIRAKDVAMCVLREEVHGEWTADRELQILEEGKAFELGE
jgi:hypothetical protein